MLIESRFYLSVLWLSTNVIERFWTRGKRKPRNTGDSKTTWIRSDFDLMRRDLNPAWLI